MVSLRIRFTVRGVTLVGSGRERSWLYSALLEECDARIRRQRGVQRQHEEDDSGYDDNPGPKYKGTTLTVTFRLPGFRGDVDGSGPIHDCLFMFITSVSFQSARMFHCTHWALLSGAENQVRIFAIGEMSGLRMAISASRGVTFERTFMPAGGEL